MKKNENKTIERKGIGFLKFFMIMRLTIFLIFFTVLSSLASESYSQRTKISLDLKQITIKNALKEIEDNTNYLFFYNNDLINVDKVVNLNVENKGIEEVLQKLFAGENIKYAILGRQIIISPKSINKVISDDPVNVSGHVVNVEGQYIPGVTVVIKGTSIGTITDVDGKYNLANVPGGATLIFSFIGMKKQEIIVGEESIINVKMISENIDIEEVVAIGYGTAKRADYPGSISSVKVENSSLAYTSNLNALESLKGNVAGLNIGASNSAGDQPSMIIRGQNSINGNNSPLIILDGVIYLGSISDINPRDISTFDILKDAVSAAVYGSRSANGVIIITTKTGNTQKPVIKLNVTSGIQTWYNKPEVMKGEQWMDVVNARNGYAEGTTSWMKSGELENLAAGEETDWLDEATRIGVTQDYQLSVSGASKGVNYYLSTAYNDALGVVEGDDFNRISVMGKVNTDITDWLKIGVDGSFSKRDYSGYGANIGSAQTTSPYGVNYRDDQGNLEKYPITQSGLNPMWGVDDGTRDNRDIRHNYRLNSFVSVDIPFIQGLNFRINYQINSDQNESGSFYHESYYVAEGSGIERYSAETIQGFLSKTNGSLNNNSTYSYVWDNILSYKKTLGEHSIGATLVATRDHSRYKSTTATGSDFSDIGNTALGMYGIAYATTQKISVGGSETANIGYLGRFSYSFNDKYFLTGSFRRDGASVFGADKKWGDFSAAGIAWKISEENFMKSINYLDYLKLKFSAGQNGNQGVSAYSTLSQVSCGSTGGIRYEFSDKEGTINYGLVQSSLGNADLGWEKTNSYNFGFESSWLKNRLTADADMYFSKTTDQIFTRKIPVMTGFKTIKTSMGQVNNIGIELTVKSVNIKTQDFKWTSAITYWKNKNKLKKLYGEDSDGDGVEDDDVSSSLFIGESLGAVYGYKQDGIVQEDDTEYMALTGASAGDPKYKDLDNVEGITSNDRTILGFSKPNFMLNLSNEITYKNFDLYMLVSGTFGGNDYYVSGNTFAYLTSGTGKANDNMTYKPYWTSENPSNKYPSASFSGDSRFKGLQSRGFVRIQDITLSYNIDQLWVKRMRINSFKVFFAAKNVATFTNWDGGDPETGAGVLSGTYPVVSTWSIGANISF